VAGHASKPKARAEPRLNDCGDFGSHSPACPMVRADPGELTPLSWLPWCWGGLRLCHE
jgi:hypothetical protein